MVLPVFLPDFQASRALKGDRDPASPPPARLAAAGRRFRAPGSKRFARPRTGELEHEPLATVGVFHGEQLPEGFRVDFAARRATCGKVTTSRFRVIHEPVELERRGRIGVIARYRKVLELNEVRRLA